MKKFLIATVLSGLILTSCQKADQEELFPAAASAVSTSAASTTSGWIPVTFTAGTADAKGQAAAQASLNSESVNDEILASGVVLVFSKDDNGVNMLPFAGADVEWNYTISKGQIAISATSAKEVTAASVLYVVIPAEKLAELEKTGYSRNDLININFEKAQSLFNIQ